MIVHNYTDPKQAQSAFMSTGTVFEWYNGMPCTDGGGMSGKNMTPLFQDGVRPQMVVNLMKTGFPTSIVFKATLTQALPIYEAGMQMAARVFKCGADKKECWSDALSLCPKGSDTKTNICQ